MVWNIGKHLYFPAETRSGIFIGVREVLLEFSYVEYNASSQVFRTFWPTSVNPTSDKCYLIFKFKFISDAINWIMDNFFLLSITRYG